MATFYLSSTAAEGFAPSNDLGKALKRTTGTAGSAEIPVANGATEASFAITDKLIPSNAAWEAGGVTVKIDVTTASSDIHLSVQAVRMNAAGVAQENSGTTAEQTLGTAGVYTFNIPSKTWVAGACDDRFLIWYYFRSSKAHGGDASVIIATDTADCSVEVLNLNEFTGTCYSAYARDVEQFSKDHSTKIATGGTLVADEGIITDNDIYLDGYVRAVRPEFDIAVDAEVRTTATSFTDASTHAQGIDLQANPDRPNIRRSATVSFDTTRNRLLLCGGLDDEGAQYNDLWELNLDPTQGSPKPQWKELSPTGTPMSARRTHVMEYDATNDRLIVGYGFDGADKGDIFEIDFAASRDGAWGTLTPTGTAPTARAQPSSAFKDTGDKFYLFGGWGASVYNDTHELDVTTQGSEVWTQLNTGGGTAPTIRNDASVIYDSANDRLIIFGGKNANTAASGKNDIWGLNLSTNVYAEITPTGTPPSIRDLAPSVYDPINGRMIISGGSDTSSSTTSACPITADVFQLDLTSGSEAWTDLTQADGHNAPFVWSTGVACYDPNHELMLIATGFDESLKESRFVVTYDLSTDGVAPQYSLNENHGFRGRDAMGYAHNPDLRHTLVAGGLADPEPGTTAASLDNGQHTGELWIYDHVNNDWLQPIRDSLLTMPCREGLTAVYDTLRNRFVIFGGLSSNGLTDNSYYSDVWEVKPDANNIYRLSKLSPTGTSPGKKWLHASVYDSVSDRMVVFGGENAAGTYLNEVHELDFSTSADGVWATLAPTGTAPTGRRQPGYIYDTTNDRMVIFSGNTAGTATMDDAVWELDLSTNNGAWTDITPGGGPSSRLTASRGVVAVYAADKEYALLFGGFDGTNVHAETWSFNLATDAYTEYTPATSPAARRSHAGGYDQTSEKFMIFGGRDSTTHGDSFITRANTYTFDTTDVTESNWDWTYESNAHVYLQASVAVTGLSTGTDYHWQLLTGNQDGDLGQNISYGDNAETAADFSTFAAGIADLIAATAAFTFTGLAAAIRRQYNLTADVQTYTVTGIAVNLNRVYIMPAAVQSYVMTGNVTDFARLYQVTCDTGGFTLTGNTTNFQYNLIIVADTQSYTLTGNDVVLAKSVTLTAETGSFTLSGIDTGLTVSRALAATTQTYTVATFPADFDRGEVMVAGLGTFILTGNSANFTVSRTLTADTQTYILSGIAANLNRNLIITGDVQTYTLTGNATTLTKAVAMPAGTVSFALTGLAASLLRGYTLAAETGSFTLTGVDATFDRGEVMVAETGVFTLTGVDASFSRGYTLPTTTGSFTLTGIDATFDRAEIMQAGVGPFTLTGIDTGLDVARTLTAEVGSFTLTGNDVTLTKAISLIAETGSFTLSGIASNLNRNFVLTADTVAFTVTTYPATLDVIGLFSVDVGPFTLTGISADLLRGYVMPTTTGSFTLTGNDATFDRGEVMVAETGSFTLTGNDATFDRGEIVPVTNGVFIVTGVDIAFTRSMVMSAEVGSFALTGVDVTFDAAEIMIAETGIFTLTGIDATFDRGEVMVADTGSFILTGNDTAFLNDEVMTADTGSFIVTTYPAGLQTEGVFAVTAGVFNLNGIDTGLTVSRTLTLDTVSFTLTGIDVALRRDYTMAADVASFSLTGLDAIVTRQFVLPAATQTYTLTGFPVSFDRAEILVVSPGIFTLSGIDTALTLNQILPVDTVSFTLSGIDTGITAARILTAETGSFTLTGNSILTSLDYTLLADTVAFTLTGIDATFDRGEIMQAGVGAFTLTGNDAGIKRQLSLSAGVGVFTLTGNDAAFDRAEIMLAETGTFTLTGNIVGLITTGTLQADTGVFTLTGNDAALKRAIIMTASVGAFTLTGNDAEFTIEEVVPVTNGEFILTGNDALITYSGTQCYLNQETGDSILLEDGGGLLLETCPTIEVIIPAEFILTGNDANLAKTGFFVVDTVSFTLTGNDAVIGHVRVLTANTGSFALTGNDADLDITEVVPVTNGVFTLTGNDALFDRTRVLTAATGEFNLTGNNASLVASGGLYAGTGVFTLTGNDVQFTVDEIIVVTSGVFTLTGNDTTTAYHRTFQCDTASFTLTGNDATFDRAEIIVVDTGVFTLAGTDTGLYRNLLLTAETGSFTLTGNDSGLYKQFYTSITVGIFTLTGISVSVLHDYYTAPDTGIFLLTGIDTELTGHFKTGYVPPIQRPRGHVGNFKPRGAGVKKTRMGRSGSGFKPRFRGKL